MKTCNFWAATHRIMTTFYDTSYTAEKTVTSNKTERKQTKKKYKTFIISLSLYTHIM